MSKLEELIQRYCPDGVEYVKIQDVCDVFTGGEVPEGSIKGDTPQAEMKYPIWGNGKEIYGYAKTYKISQDAVCISSIGANTGDVFFHRAFFTPIIRLKVLIPQNERLSIRFLYYALSSVDFEVKKSSVPNMNANEVKQKAIPLPPLPVQEEIVRILDTFSELQKGLIPTLQAELQKRLQQYNYYRDYLLSFEDRADVEWKSVSSVAQVCRGVRVVKSQLSNEGYPVYQNCLTPMGYFDKTNCPGGSPFVIFGGAAGNVGYTDVDCWAADDCEYILAGTEVCSRYIYHCLMTKKPYLVSQVRKASIPRLSPSVIKEMEIPVPSLEEQEKIASILDRFDALTTDLTIGLPAEIEKRRLQYEFYRDKLLTFKRKEA